MNSMQRQILFIAILASFVAFLDSSVVGVALPQISAQLGGNLLIQQWVNDAYLITLGTLILAAGSLSDIFGRKKILVAGLIGFMVTSLLCAGAQTGIELVIARGLQGVAGALLVPSSLALIISAFKGAEQSKAIGRWTGWTGMAFIVGPLVGGLMVDLLSWRLVFAINVLSIIIALVLTAKVEPEISVNVRSRLDVRGILFGAIGLGGIVYALIEQGHYGRANLLVWGIGVIGLISMGLFLLHEKHVKQPMLPLGLFHVRNFSVGNVATLFIYAALALQGFLLVIFLQQVAGYSATFAGIASIPITIIMFFLSSRFGALAGRYGPRLFMAAGPIVAGFGTLLMLMTRVPTNYWSELLPGIIIFGLGLSITVAPLTSAILGSISSSEAGIGSAVNNAVARIAGLLSIAMIGLFVGNSITLQGFHDGLIICSTLLIAGGIVSALGIQNKKI